MTHVTDMLTGRADYHRAMSQQSLLCADCPECRSEILVNLGTSHRPFSDNEKMLYRLVCSTCGLSYDVHFEDLRLCEKSDSEIATRNPITTFGRA